MTGNFDDNNDLSPVTPDVLTQLLQLFDLFTKYDVANIRRQLGPQAATEEASCLQSKVLGWKPSKYLQ